MAVTKLPQATQLVLSWTQPEMPDSSTPRPPEPTFVRHDRARRYVIRVTGSGVVRVTIPRWGSKREAQAFAERERAWIAKEWRKYVEERKGLHGLEQHAHEGPNGHGRQNGREEQNGHERQNGREGHDGREGQDGRQGLSEVEKQLRERARRELPPRLMALAAVHGLVDRVTKISIRNQKWRWGSCSPNGHICLNWRLVTMADTVRDYVLVHELMHLKRMDHSARFWKLVADACPDYREARAVLRRLARP